MASVFKMSDRRPVPAGAERFTRAGRRYARFTDGRGRRKTQPVAEDDEGVMLVERRCWYIAYVDGGGARRRVKGFTDKGASEQKGRDLERHAERHRVGLEDDYDTHRASAPLGEALGAWLADLRRRGKSAMYIYNMGLRVGRLAEGCGWRALAGVRSDTLCAWLAKQAGLAPRTLNQYTQSARAFLNWCCAQQPPWLPANPLLKVGRADETEKRREKRALTLDELDRLKKVSGSRWVIYLTAALTGLRRSELKRLQWGDMNLDADLPHIQLRATATKAKRPGTVPVNPELLEALRGIRATDVRADQPVFPRLPKYATYRKDVEARAKIPWRDEGGRLASFHSLRKTFATYLALADVPLRVAMDMMRVTDAKLLTGVYTDAKLFNTAAAAARLPRLHRPQEQEEGRETA